MMKVLSIVTLISLLSLTGISQSNNKPTEKRVYYCEYCGHKFPTVRMLTSGTCSRNPNGSNKGPHKLYEGSEKSIYTCKYCGRQFPSIMVMTGGTCVRHPKGSNKGAHAPEL